jgi:hypothetical protein
MRFAPSTHHGFLSKTTASAVCGDEHPELRFEFQVQPRALHGALEPEARRPNLAVNSGSHGRLTSTTTVRTPGLPVGGNLAQTQQPGSLTRTLSQPSLCKGDTIRPQLLSTGLRGRRAGAAHGLLTDPVPTIVLRERVTRPENVVSNGGR